MTPERWRRIEEIYHAALERDASQRQAFVREVCAGDEALRREVEWLLAQPASVEGLLDAPTRALVLELVEGDTLADRFARGPIPVREG